MANKQILLIQMQLAYTNSFHFWLKKQVLIKKMRNRAENWKNYVILAKLCV